MPCQYETHFLGFGAKVLLETHLHPTWIPFPPQAEPSLRQEGVSEASWKVLGWILRGSWEVLGDSDGLKICLLITLVTLVVLVALAILGTRVDLGNPD